MNRIRMASRHKNTLLYVKALEGKDVHEIDERGMPLMACRTVGKDNGIVIDAGVLIPYHSHYIARLKEGMLLPMDLETAKLAGVLFSPLNLGNN